MKTLVTVVAVLVVSVVITCADSFSIGTSNMEGYDAEYASVATGRAWLYWEHEPNLPYDLVIGTYRITKDVGAVIRHDSPNWTRPGIDLHLGGGKIRALAGVGSSPSWLEIFTPPVKVADNLALEGHFRLKSEGKTDWWVGPRYQSRSIGLWYHHNLRESGSWEGGVDLNVASW